jgi:hypothetical protein
MAVQEAPPVVEETETEAEAVIKQLPLFEGCRVTDYRLNFGGNVPLGDLELIKQLKLNNNATVTLEIDVEVVSAGGKKTKDGEGNVTGTVKSSNVVVKAVRLADAAAE